MSTITVTQLYEQLTKHMGEETAEHLCTYVNSKISEELEDRTKILATKDDINDLRLATKEDINALKADINDLRLATKEDINNLRLVTKEEIVELHTKFIESKADTMRWMFIFWVGQVAATFGLLMLFIKK